MSVSLTYKSTVETQETLETSVVAASNPQITLSGYNSSQNLTSATTVPVTKCAYFSKALSAGAATIDLTALTGTNGAAVDFTGLKVQVAKFTNPSTNANSITVTFGASNGFLLGGTAWKWILLPGQEITFYGNDATTDVDATHKTIDLAGTAAQALQVSLIAG